MRSSAFSKSSPATEIGPKSGRFIKPFLDIKTSVRALLFQSTE